MALTYPRCYKGEKWFNRPYVCGPGKDLSWVKYDSDEDLQKITSWTGSGYPLTLAEHTPEYYPGPPLSGMGSDDEEEDKENLVLKIGRGIQSFFKLADRGVGAAKVLGYAAIAGVGGGLLLWYVPRTKR